MNRPGSSSGTSSNNVSGPAAVWGVTAQTRAGEAARAEVLRLQESLRLAVSALQAIGDRARYLSRYSARVRVLELEVIPAGSYLSDRAGLLLGELDVRQVPGRWAAGMTAPLDEMRVMLEWAIEVTASVDIPGELGLPLELVSTVQSGARARMACLDRLRQILEDYDAAGAEHYEPDPRVAALQPSRPARWVLRAAGRLLPLQTRDRYREEFASELLALAEAKAGSASQLAHALRQAGSIWALRRALPSATLRRTGLSRVHAPLTTDLDTTVRRHRVRDDLREPLERWFARRHARKVLRDQRRTQQAQYARYGIPPPRGRHRR
jgi:hypothetical protein